MLKASGFARACSLECIYSHRNNRKKPKKQKPHVNGNIVKNAIPYDTRLLIKERDAGRCRWMGCRGSQIHHIEYKSEGGSNEPHNLILLCDKHHKLAHSNKNYYQPLLRGVIYLYYVENQSLMVHQVEKMYGAYVAQMQQT